VRRLGEATSPNGEEGGLYSDFASYTLTIALKFRINHEKHKSV